MILFAEKIAVNLPAHAVCCSIEKQVPEEKNI